ncbi:MAG: hypothetical protein IJ131_02180, partial [Eggerthellaceae bacterium]|nr:hypothetical protein [Eggerthellaceae bacterium]
MDTAHVSTGKKLVSLLLALVLAITANGPLLAYAAEGQGGQVDQEQKGAAESQDLDGSQGAASVLSLGSGGEDGTAQPAVPSTKATEYYTSGGDDFASARTISTNTTYLDSLVSNGDEDWFKVYLSGKGALSVRFESTHYVTGSDYNRHFYDVYLYNDQSEELWNRDVIVGTTQANAAATLATTGLKAGWYYIKVETYHFTGKTYKISANFTASNAWETEFNDSMSTATPISLNKQYAGTLMERGDDDWYKVTLPSAGALSVSFESTHYVTGSDYQRHCYDVYLYNDQDEEIWERGFFVGTTKADAAATLATVGLPKGTYFIKVDYYNNWTDKKYLINAKFTASNVWETEFNDSMSTADALASNTTYSATLRERSDKDWYKVTLTKNGPLDIVFEPTYYTTGSDYNRTFYTVGLYDDQNNNKWEKRVLVGTTKGSGKTTLTSGTLAKGTYYIEVEDYNWTDKTYKITAKYDLTPLSSATVT